MQVYLRKKRGELSLENEKRGKGRKYSLYLVYHYGPDQKRDYEFLKLYLYEKPKTILEKEHNMETMQLAETIRAQKVLDGQATAHGFVSSVRSRVGFLAYFKKLTDKRFDESSGNHGNWLSTYKHLTDFMKGKDIPLERIDDRFLESFKEYILSCKARRGMRHMKLNANTAQSYFNKVKATLRDAYQNRMIKENPSMRVKTVKSVESHRSCLTFEELQQLYRTECELPIMKKAFLFSALTGLRYSDVKGIKWSNIKYSETDGWFLQYIQKKTKAAEVLPISEQAIKLLGEKINEEALIFESMNYSSWNNKKLGKWVSDAGITKKITFHCARHSFATIQLSMDTDIYTVSKLLGHRHLKTTEIYAKVIDKKKIEAASRIPELLMR